MERFLNEEAVRNSRKRSRRYERIIRVLAVFALAFFVVVCLLTNDRIRFSDLAVFLEYNMFSFR